MTGWTNQFFLVSAGVRSRRGKVQTKVQYIPESSIHKFQYKKAGGHHEKFNICGTLKKG